MALCWIIEMKTINQNSRRFSSKRINFGFRECRELNNFNNIFIKKNEILIWQNVNMRKLSQWFLPMTMCLNQCN